MLTFREEFGEFYVLDDLGEVIATGDEGMHIYWGYLIGEQKLLNPKPSSLLHRPIESTLLNKEIKRWNQI